MKVDTNRETAPTPDKAAYSIPEFGAIFGPGKTLTYEEINSGRLRARKVGKKTLITHSDAMVWLNSLPELKPQAKRQEGGNQ